MSRREWLLAVAPVGPWCASTAGWALVVTVLVPLSDRILSGNRA